MTTSEITYKWRGPVTDPELDALHAEAFDHPHIPIAWTTQLTQNSLGWVTARDPDDALLGFVKVIWDGDAHAFLLDTMTTSKAHRQGIGTELVAIATREARAAGCEWLHVDFEPHLAPFYFQACGFRPTDAGLIQLK